MSRSYGNNRRERITIWVPSGTKALLQSIAKKRGLTLGELCWRFLEYVLKHAD